MRFLRKNNLHIVENPDIRLTSGYVLLFKDCLLPEK